MAFAKYNASESPNLFPVKEGNVILLLRLLYRIFGSQSIQTKCNPNNN